MACCAPTIQGFINADTVTIPYSAQMAHNYGARPKVEVWIQDGSEFIATLSIMVRKALVGWPVTTSVIIYLGGPATGIVRIR